MKYKKSEKLKKTYFSVCNKYLKAFCEKQDFEFDENAWVNEDIGGVAMINDMFLNFSDIVWDVNSEQPKGMITEWYYMCLENAINSINYFSYTHGIRIKDLER